MILEEGALDEQDEDMLKTRKLQFMINDVFLTTTLQDLMDRLSLTGEHILEIWYSFSLDKPKPSLSLP